MIFGTILAGGSGTRMQNAVPKQFLPLGNAPILIRTLRVFLQCDRLDAILVAVPANRQAETEALIRQYEPDAAVAVVAGGASRTDTLFALIDEIHRRFGQRPDDLIVTHDAVRPFITVPMLCANIDAAQDGAAGTAIPAVDTIIETLDGQTVHAIPPRSQMYLMQTPQTFSVDLLCSTFATLTDDEKARLTDGCGVLVTRGIPVRLSPGSPSNIKITTPADYEIAKQMASESDRT